MDAAEIIHLLEKPTKNRWSLVGHIRDEATISDIVTALRTSTTPSSLSERTKQGSRQRLGQLTCHSQHEEGQENGRRSQAEQCR